MSYTYSAGQYNFTLKLFMRCNSGRTFNDPAIVSVFDRVTNARIIDITVPLANQEIITLTNPNPCITNPPTVCYVEGYYYFSASLPETPNGYILSSQVNYRVNGISNLINGYGNIGATYTAEIPGTADVPSGPQNNSAVFVGSDLVIVCAENHFTYSFAAEDPDGDQLQYTFCDAYQSGSSGGGAVPTPPPPYTSVPYGNGFNGSSPLGASVQIDPNTGLISGIAPASGIYVVTVCVSEIRNGQVIAIHRKDLQIHIADCSIASAILEPQYQLCRNSYTIHLENLSTSPLITSYQWTIKNRAGSTIYSATTPTVTYTFADTGRYIVKLTINPGGDCSDSTSSVALVYPGFSPAFTATGICFNRPTLFTDNSTSVYGTVHSWRWDFGENNTAGDTSNLQNPGYTYLAMGMKNVLLSATNSVGCHDTVSHLISIIDKPPVTLSFRDTLLCLHDSVQLHATGTGSFSWRPSVNIQNVNTASPTVFPSSTTRYVVTLDDNGCMNKDSVLVRITDHVTVTAMRDTTICSSDTIQLRITTDALKFSWQPSAQLIDPAVADPLAITNNNTKYIIRASIGSCSSSDSILVTAVPHPIVHAGNDTVICLGGAAILNGSTDGSSYNWSPSFFLNDPHTLTPVSTPTTSIRYVLTAYDKKGCPKPGIDTVQVIVHPKVHAYAGSDTSVIAGEPLQLLATGGSRYLWTPATDLSNAGIPNPVAVFTEAGNNITLRVEVSDNYGCKDVATKHVKVFAGAPVIYVANAFTPNDDGRNDILNYVTVGIKRVENFSVYNRIGQLIFSSNNGKGWDGKFKGIPQDAGAFVWIVKAIDYKNRSYFNKGTVMLIR